VEYVVAIIVGAAVLGGAFVLGLMTDDRRWALVPAVLPLGLLIWTAVLALTENPDDCYETCGSSWGLAFTIVSVVPALILAAAIALGVAVNRRGSARRSLRHRPG
jgi:hypothetical protein